MNLRRILSLLLTVLMVVSALPLNAIAEEMMIANLEELIAAIEEPAVEEVVSELPEEEPAVEPSAPVEEETEGQEMQTLSMEDVALLLAEEEGAVEETAMPEMDATVDFVVYDNDTSMSLVKLALIFNEKVSDGILDSIINPIKSFDLYDGSERKASVSLTDLNSLSGSVNGLEHGKVYALKYKQGWINSKEYTKYFRFNLYKDINVDIDPSDIGGSINVPGEVNVTEIGDSMTIGWSLNTNVTKSHGDTAYIPDDAAYQTGFTAGNVTGYTAEAPVLDFEGGTLSVTYTANKYDVIWKDGDDNIVKEVEVSHGDDVPAYDGVAPTKTNTAEFTYTWKETWTNKNTDNVVDGKVVGDVIYTADFDATTNKYTITWNVDGEETEETYEYGAILNPTNPVNADEKFKFAGWKDENGNVVEDWSSVTVSGDATYTATWTELNTVTWKLDENTVHSVVPYEKGAAIVAPVVTKEGHTFVKWDADVTTMGDESLTFTAEWTVNSYGITWIADGKEYKVETLSFGADIVKPETPEKEGYDFIGWNPEVAEKMPAKDLTYTAEFKKIATKTIAINKYMALGEDAFIGAIAGLRAKVLDAAGKEAAEYDKYEVTAKVGIEQIGFEVTVKINADDSLVVLDDLGDIVGSIAKAAAPYALSLALKSVKEGETYAFVLTDAKGSETYNMKVVDSRSSVKIELVDNEEVDYSNGIFYATTWDEEESVEDKNTLEKAAVTKAVKVTPAVDFSVDLKEGKYVVIIADSKDVIGDTVPVDVSFEVYEYTITFYDVDGEKILDKQEDVKHGTTPVYAGEELEKEGYVVSWVPAIVPAVENAKYTLKWLPENDLNGNDVPDEEETGKLKVNVVVEEGAVLGTYTVSGGHTVTGLGNDTYAVLMNANEDSAEVTITATAEKSTDASKFYYVNPIDPIKVTKGAEATATVTFAVDELDAKSGNTASVNFYSATTKAAGLKGKILDAAGLSGDDITVEIKVDANTFADMVVDYIEGSETIKAALAIIGVSAEKISGYIENLVANSSYKAEAYLNIEKETEVTLGSWDIPISAETVQAVIGADDTYTFRFTKNGEKNGETYTLTAEADVKFAEEREYAPLVNVSGKYTYAQESEVDAEAARLKNDTVPADLEGREDVLAKVKLGERTGTFPAEDGKSADIVYKVTYPEDEFYLGNTVEITITATFNATDAILRVTEDQITNAGYEILVDGVKVEKAGDSNLQVEENHTIAITPDKGKVIKNVTVYEGAEAITASDDVTFQNGIATVEFAVGYPETETIYTFKVDVEDIAGFVFVKDQNENKEPATYNYKYVPGQMANVEDVYNTVVVSPALTGEAGEKFTVEYKAREEGKVKVTLTENLKIELVPGLPAVELPIAGEYEIELKESWRSVGDPVLPSETPDQVVQRVAKNLLASPEQILNKISMDDILNAIRNQDYSGISDEVMDIIEDAIQEDLKNFKARNFGEGADSENAVEEKLRVTYKNNQYALDYDYTTVKVSDTRKETKIVVPETVTVTYGQYDEAGVKAALAPVVKAGDEVVADAEVIYSYLGDSIEGLNASEDGYTINLSYAGGEGYKASSATAKLIVKKAKIETFDYDSQIVTYGTPYTFKLVTSAADAQVIEFIVGVDVAKANVTPDGLSGILPEVWVKLPQSIMDLVNQLNSYLPDELKFNFKAGGYELGKFFDLLERVADYAAGLEGNTLDMGTVTTLLTKLTEIKNKLGVDNMIVYVNQGYPEDIGVYIAGAVSADTNYETAYTADYLLIVPQTTEAELSWLYNDDNFIVTLPVVKENADYLKAEANIDLSKHDATIEYLYIGYDANGEFRLITNDTTTFTENDYGAYVQIAYVLKWDNEAVYAMPIVRPLVIVPELYTVTFEDANENNIRVFEFDNTSKAMNVKVTDQAGKDVTNDVELNVRYIGMKTNTETYNETTGPKNAGAYAVVATAIGRENGVVVGAGMNVGAMVITPTESEITVIEDDNHVRLQSMLPEGGLAVADLVKSESTVVGLTPDYTTITGTINIENVTKDGKLLENINGNVNVDLPEWVYRNDFLPERLKDGVTAAGLSAALKEAVAKVNGNAVAPLSLEDDINTAKSAMDLLGIDASELASAVQTALGKLGTDVDVSGVKSALEAALEQLDTTADVSDMAAAIQEALGKLGTDVDFADAVSAAQTALDKLGVNITSDDIAGFVQTALKQLGKNVDISNAPAFVQDALKQLADYVETADIAGIIKEALNKIGTNADYSDVAESIQKALEEMGKGADIADMTGFVQKIMEELAKKVDMSDLEAATQKALEEMGVNVDVAAVSDAISSILANVDMKSDFVNMAGALIEVLDKIPSNLNVTFENDQHLKNIGAYAIIGVVTDSDHIPSVDADYLLITPAIAEITFKDANNNNQILHTYNGKRQGVEVESINIVPTGVANWDALKITYTGIESAIDIEGNEMVNTPGYHSELAPIETGAYLVTATYCDVADGTIKAVGIELGVMVIAPAEADIAVNGGIFTEPVKVADIVETTPATGVETTVITTGISVSKETEKAISEAIATGKVPSVKDMQGNVAYVNVDLPAWVDAALEVMGVNTEGTVEISVLKEKVSVLAKLYAKAKEIAREQTTGKAAMAAGVLASIAGINAEEALEILKKVDDNVEVILAKLIEVLDQYGTTIEVTLTDVEDQEALANKGLYLVTAIVTDTDYLPAIDTDFVVITPAIADITFVDGNNNNLFRRVYNGKPQEIKAEVTMKPATVAVNPKALKITYTGIESAIDFEGKEMVNTPFYHSTVAPTQTGAYLVTAFYYDANEDGTVKGVGIELGKLVIVPDAADIAVNGGVFNAPVKVADLVEVTQDNGEGFDPETTVITTGISVSGATEKAILAAIAKGEAPAIKDIYGNAAHVYADLPAWLDAALEVMGIDTDKPVEIQTLSATIAEIEELYAKAKDIAREKTDGEAAIAAGIVATVLGIDAVEVLDILKDVDDNIEAVLAKLVEVLNKYEPTLKVSLQDVEDQAALETGLYLVSAMITDTDYLPAFDSDFVLISKVATKVEIDSKIVTYDGKNKPVSVYVNGVLTNSDNLTVRYTGVQTDGKTVNSATAPKYAGVYAVTARYAEFSKDGSELVAFGADVGMLVIEPKALEMSFAPANNIHLYDGTEKAPVAEITCCEESGQYKTIITAVKVNETTVNLNVSDEFVAQVKGIINALDETYDAAAAKLPEEAKNMIKAMAALAGITTEDVEQLKKMVKDATSDNVQIDDYDIGGLKVIAKLLNVSREKAKELVLALDSNVESLINFVMSDEDADLVLHYAETVAMKLASYSAQVVGQINDMVSFIEREIEEGAAKVTFNENPTEIGVYPVVALGYLNSDHYIGVAKGQMEIRGLFEIQAARMHLASALAMEFAWFQSDIIEGKDYYLQVTKTYGDGRPNRVVKVPMSQWGVDGNYYFAGIDKIAAKGMADTMYAQVFFADGTAASTVWVDSVRDYAMRILATTESGKSKTLMVDMLNYGAAAQTYFNYNEADLANNQLSDAQKAFATGEVELANNLVKGEGYVASALQLQDYIKLNVKFNNIDSTMKAVVTYTNHYGVDKKIVIDGSDFEDGNIIVINHDLAAADFRQLITCVVYDANGNEVTRVVESVESYLCRLSQYNTLYGMVAKYTAAAYSYFH